MMTILDNELREKMRSEGRATNVSTVSTVVSRVMNNDELAKYEDDVTMLERFEEHKRRDHPVSTPAAF